jgi:hypothetical protein
MDSYGRKDIERSHKPFTPGWRDQLDGIEALPIKRGAKVVKVRKPATQRTLVTENEEGTGETIIGDDEDVDKSETTEKPIAKKAPKEVVVPQPLVLRGRTKQETAMLRQHIADICTSITSNPEAAVLRKHLAKEASVDYGIKDLLNLLQSRDVEELELGMLSAALVFKDICPSYRIRFDDTGDTEVELKKETKKIRDFEIGLLKSYQRLLKLLDERVCEGLGNARHVVTHWGLSQRVAFVALQSLCELLRSLHQFNLRTSLLNVITGRASQPCAETSNLCCDALDHVLKHDIGCDLSFEFVGIISKILTVTKYAIPERLLRCLQSIKLTVHEDKIKTLQLQVKSERKKRKRNQDSLEATLLEANIEAEKLSRRRFQGNSLQEIALIYFRILKAKVGFRMLPEALEGLGRITHLINLDTVHDLLSNLRTLLALEPAPPAEVRLLCVHCALSTLAGPGQELRVDEEPYLRQLQGLLQELPASFQYWPALIDTLDLALLKKRVESHDTVKAFVRLLLLNAVHHLGDVGAVLLAITHNILLRYPRLRQSLLASWATDPVVAKRGGLEDDKMEDLAMKALREGDTTQGKAVVQSAEEEDLGEGSWNFALIKHHPDPKYGKILSTMLSKDIAPLPFKPADTAMPIAQVASNQMDLLMRFTKQSLHPIVGNGKAKPKAAQATSAKHSKMQVNKKQKKKKGNEH